MAPADVQAIERAIAGVPGVSSAAVVLSDAGGLGRLRVTFESGADRAAVAKDVSELLATQFGMKVDEASMPRPVPAAEVEAEPEPEAAVEPDVPVARHDDEPGRSEWRPVIRGLRLSRSGVEARVEAILGINGTTVRGASSAPAIRAPTLRAVALATLRAVEELVGPAARLDVESVEFEESGDSVHVVSTIAVLTLEGAEKLVGVAIVRDGDEEKAVMRSTLDAVNRRLPMLAEPQIH